MYCSLGSPHWQGGGTLPCGGNDVLGTLRFGNQVRSCHLLLHVLVRASHVDIDAIKPYQEMSVGPTKLLTKAVASRIQLLYCSKTIGTFRLARRITKLCRIKPPYNFTYFPSRKLVMYMSVCSLAG